MDVMLSWVREREGEKKNKKEKTWGMGKGT